MQRKSFLWGICELVVFLYCRWLAGGWRMGWSSGMSATPGAPTGESRDSLVSWCTSTTLHWRLTATGGSRSWRNPTLLNHHPLEWQRLDSQLMAMPVLVFARLRYTRMHVKIFKLLGVCSVAGWLCWGLACFMIQACLTVHAAIGQIVLFTCACIWSTSVHVSVWTL